MLFPTQAALTMIPLANNGSTRKRGPRPSVNISRRLEPHQHSPISYVVLYYGVLAKSEPSA